jgi:hypothetical protein
LVAAAANRVNRLLVVSVPLRPSAVPPDVGYQSMACAWSVPAVSRHPLSAKRSLVGIESTTNVDVVDDCALSTPVVVTPGVDGEVCA